MELGSDTIHNITSTNTTVSVSPKFKKEFISFFYFLAIIFFYAFYLFFTYFCWLEMAITKWKMKKMKKPRELTCMLVRTLTYIILMCCNVGFSLHHLNNGDNSSLIRSFLIINLCSQISFGSVLFKQKMLKIKDLERDLFKYEVSLSIFNSFLCYISLYSITSYIYSKYF
jgi:hypothetical protein